MWKDIHNLPRLSSVRFLNSGYGYGSLKELPEVSCTGIVVLKNSQKSLV